MFKVFNINDIKLPKYLFFTGKGGVGKTSIASATAIGLADKGKKVLLISTDPASNLQDVFGIDLDNKGTLIKEVSNLVVLNLNPEEAAREYKESVMAPYRGKLPETVLNNMEEQLSGSCTVEIAAFNEFSTFITDKDIQRQYDHIIFDTAPTGHTLRMLQLPSAWSDFISESTHGASCLGQLSGLESKKDMYKQAVETLGDGEVTKLILIARAEYSPLKEAKRASKELRDLGVNNQMMIINGILELDEGSKDDDVSNKLYSKQQEALKNIPDYLKDMETYRIPLRSYSMTGVKNIRLMLKENYLETEEGKLKRQDIPNLKELIDDLYISKKKVIFTMGKGGVGKTSLAAVIAVGLSRKGVKVHLATTDPAHHLKFVVNEDLGISLSNIDEKEELNKYKEEVLKKARETMSEEDIEYIEEDLRSPCTQEIAVFRAFAEIVEKAEEEVVVIDTAPTGHTLLLLDSTESYNKEIQRSKGDIPSSVQNLLPRLRNEDETEVVIVTLPEATPVYEAMRLEKDLKRAGIKNKWWIINSSLFMTNTKSPLLKTKASSEIQWINKVDEISKGNFVVIPWKSEEIKGEELVNLIK
ncbi:arsenical pump-driving ATPase [Clostridium algidicarnis]|uniref:arsenical pump-driving ATPase n=1 Tax=Clostridium algidicarnis TaxID=37659 RepID=UPI001C0DF888|nr:arsenical pump-driving ATPase [Clostridium algidicarnis]MBU3204426.1 arsenical pump-driving ATPase [Clostridium algidicarnis]MBU3212491.1 arsenical pump-driving ATPase [Clostridium algidicarnis]MBU3222922.1 arsenical pump-driving ATPase [Clostridium algidicarnis]